jgi:hypothetical protein
VPVALLSRAISIYFSSGLSTGFSSVSAFSAVGLYEVNFSNAESLREISVFKLSDSLILMSRRLM